MERLGLIYLYKRAGFKVGIPGCSMCVGQGVDQAASGEKWLSSQNRNFPNRMGPRSIANLASAATVAASSFQMKIANPRQLLDAIDMDKLQKYLEYQPFKDVETESATTLRYSEPYGTDQEGAMTQICKPMQQEE
ncbi:hypothetical protein BDV96DRAFT_648392 [Lophiotrema nucula]|uniref:Aconitase/3-isopropylmalate dehydratase large subunit alpha/beta/alpha domain-containing protein n=1 Tax=Lophiotrema nucula TaxID=690887 RepID=A0A6A5Z359_9PLEO|nr:hypothetical protein BDV96DRAFT_648392 [Lophiotrema nucula]